MKPFLEIRVLVCGEWESLTTRPGRRFYPGTAKLVPAKRFPVSGLEKAKAFAREAGYSRFTVVKVSPPVPSSRDWGTVEIFTTETATA